MQVLGQFSRAKDVTATLTKTQVCLSAKKEYVCQMRNMSRMRLFLVGVVYGAV
jgi:hypothetical protein